MKKFALYSTAAALALSACGPTVGNTPVPATVTTTPPASSSSAATSTQGYGITGTDIFDPTTFSYDASAQVYTADTSSGLSQAGASFTLANATATTIDFTYNGSTATLTNTGGTTYSGAHPSFPSGVTLSFVTTASSSGGAKVALWTFQASGSGDAGFVAFGPNSDPTNIAGLTGTATYTDNGLGKARINVVHDNSGSFGVGRATGQVSLVADFDADTISGSIFNITDNGSDVGYSITNGASITLEATSITGNTFNSGLTLAPSQFGLSDLTAGYASGMFYGSDGTTNGKGGTTIGGTLTGTGTSQVTGGTAVISGGFVAE